MEDLNKTQIVLVCLLVSFVTSIGTGIITATLIQEAPPSVTQTINRVVERTVEQVVPANVKNTVTKEVTIVVKEEDLVIDAINKNSRSLARISENLPQGEKKLISIGAVISSNGTILTDKSAISVQGSYTAEFFDGRTFPVKIITGSETTNAIFLSVLKGSEKPEYVFYPTIIANSDVVLLGQTVISLGGVEKNTVAIGRITGLVGKSAASSAATSSEPISIIQTDAVASGAVLGTFLLNLNGGVVAMRLPPVGETDPAYVAINILKRANPSYFEAPNRGE